MATSALLDHLAIGVSAWSDGYDVFADRLGGVWSHGGDAGEFAPYQLVYQHGMRLELIAPGSHHGFMHRFIERDGPGPHHLTFKVPSLKRALEDVAALGIEPLGGRTDIPFWDEAFLHPKACALGTLIQLAEVDADLLASQIDGSPPPSGFPTTQQPQQELSWIGVTTTDLSVARALLLDVLEGAVEDEGPDWMLVGWGPGRRLLVRYGDAVPGGDALWSGAPAPGVAHVVVGAVDLAPGSLAADPSLARQLEHDPRTRLPVWLAGPAVAN